MLAADQIRQNTRFVYDPDSAGIFRWISASVLMISVYGVCWLFVFTPYSSVQMMTWLSQFRALFHVMAIGRDDDDDDNDDDDDWLIRRVPRPMNSRFCADMQNGSPSNAYGETIGQRSASWHILTEWQRTNRHSKKIGTQHPDIVTGVPWQQHGVQS